MRTVAGKLVMDSLEELIDPAHAALLVVDMQNDLVSDNGAYARWGSDVTACRAVIPAISRLLAAARASGARVVYSMNTTLPGGASDSPAWIYFKTRARPGIAPEYTLDGTWGQEIVPELAPRAGEPVIKKHRSNAFVGTSLDLVLRGLGVQTVVVAGIVTHGCVEATLRHAAFLDYYTVLVEDACAASDPALHEAALTMLRARHDLVPERVVSGRWLRRRAAA